MRWLLLTLGLLLLPGGAEAQTVLWFNGFETGSVLECTNTPAAGSAVAGGGAQHGGAYYFHITGSTAGYCQSATGAGLTTIFARLYYRWDQTNTDEHILQVLNAGRTKGEIIYLISASKKIAWGHNALTPTATSTTALTVSTYYRLDVKCVVSATVGGCELKINGSTEFSSFVTNTSDVGTYDHVEFGPQLSAGIWDFGFDDEMVCSGAYCPDGVTVARQGVSGTPTYDSWTKTSCTGGTIDGCWSNTPFSTGSNANSASASAAQTMIVHDFGTTQSGHGSEAMGNASTINACKTAGVIKSGTASAPLSIRRRISGTDTDTAKTLTTSDAYYDDGIWTTTAGVLRSTTAMEIGALHGTGTATDTVEDMWLICDYLDGTAAIKHKVRQDNN